MFKKKHQKTHCLLNKANEIRSSPHPHVSQRGKLLIECIISVLLMRMPPFPCLLYLHLNAVAYKYFCKINVTLLQKDWLPFHGVILYANKRTMKVAFKYSINVHHNNKDFLVIMQLHINSEEGFCSTMG